MNALTISIKGQITLKRELLRHLGVHPGEKIEVVELPGGELRIRAAKPSGRIDSFIGSLRRDGQAVVSIDEMNAAIGEGWAGRS
jgi:bifunctional DNA-binding transcriptional regulator/antitoxin component of YhaV-PrlF toxin-antitoxin module